MVKPTKEDQSGGSLQLKYQESYAEAAKGIKPYAWAIGISSAVIVFGVLYIFQLFSTGLHQARLYEQMLTEVETKSPIKVKLTLPALSSLLSPKDSRVQRVADVIYLSEGGQFDKALQRLKHSSFPVLEANDEYEEVLSNLLEKAAAPKPSTTPKPLDSAATQTASDVPLAETADREQNNDELKQELWAYGNAMLRELATPAIPGSVRRVYTSVVQHTKAKGFKFPPLPEREG